MGMLQETFIINGWMLTLIVSVNTLLVLSCALLIWRNLTSLPSKSKEQHKFYQLFQEAADPIVILSKTGFITAANPAVEKVSGYTPEELVGKHFAKIDVLRGVSLTAALKIFAQTVRGESSDPYEYEINHRDGSVVYAEANVRPMKHDGKVIGVQCIFRDVTPRVSAEKALLREKDNAQRYLNIAGVLMMALDHDGNVTMINKKGCETIGLPEKEILGKNWFEYFIPENGRKRLKECFSEILKGRLKPFERLTTEVVTADKKNRMIAWHNTVILDKEDRVIGTLSSGEDITDRIQKDALLSLQSEALNAADNGIVITDRDGRIIWANPAFNKLTGYTLNEVRGKNPRILKSGKHEKSFYTNMWDTILSGRVWHSEIINRRKDGQLYTEEMTLTPVMDEKNKITNFIAIKQDISERKWAEEAIRQQFSFLQRLIDTIPNPIFYKNKDCRYVGCNVAFEKFIGVDKKFIMGKTVFDIAPKDAAEEYHEMDLQLIEKGGVQSYETDVLQADGTRRSVLFYKAAYAGTDEPIAGLVGIMLDISDRKQMEKKIEDANQNMVMNERLLRNLLKDLEKTNQELRETQSQLIQSEKLAAVGTLSSGIAHEIKNPLSIILLSVESLETQIKKGLPSIEKAGTCTEMIRKAADRANNIVVELLKFSRFSKIDLEPVRLHEIIENALELVKNHSKMKDVKCIKEFIPEDVRLMGDPILLEQVFVNLLANAMDAIDDKGTINIQTSLKTKKEAVSGHEICIRIEDTGSGMSENVAKRIFEPFFTTKEQGKGTGLGLSTAYMILQKHNGLIEVESKPGEGTVFTMTLPPLKE